MTNEQILKKAIKKAVKNGWRFEGWFNEDGIQIIQPEFYKDKDYKECVRTRLYKIIIFSHDFAKAFWYLGKEKKGETILAKYCEKKCKQFESYHPTKIGHWHENWQYHIYKMVLEKEPLKYLEKFL